MTYLPELAGTLRGAAGGASHNKVNGTDRMTFVPEVFTRATTTHAPLGEGDPDRWEEADVASPRTAHSPVARELVVADDAWVAPTLTAHKSWRLNCANDQFVVTDTLRSHPRPGSATTGALTVAHTLRAEGADASEDGTGRGTPLVVTGTLAPGAHPGGLTGREADAGQLVVSRPLTAHPAGSRLDGESDQFVVSPTLRGFGHGWQGQHNDDAARMQMVRRLTPLEAERLQGFPDGWTEGFADSVRYRMLGNAVAVPMAEWVLRRLARAAAQR
ncbi:MAG: DNA cytosine methyltransferase [Candidatus Dormibacteraeota bacterium]|nr:DNA cytosine methyltransferase [Candidatus Dormibacteraeota bacterium]